MVVNKYLSDLQRKNLVINGAHIMLGYKHTPLKEIRHNIRKEARKTIVQLIGKNEEKNKLKGSRKKKNG
jgi:hypothetical protein